MLIKNYAPVGNLKEPLSGLVLHFGEGGAFSQPCEAAWLALKNASFSITPPKVRIYVSKSSIKTMSSVYAPLGGAVTVEPLEFSKTELDAQAFLSLMAVGASSSSMPLYMHTIIVSPLHQQIPVVCDSFVSCSRAFFVSWGKVTHLRSL